MKLRRVLASILALCMVLSTMGFTVFAESAERIEVKNSEELIAALEQDKAGATVVMMNDITVTAELSNAYGKTGINIKYGQTLDGNGYKLIVNGATGTWDTAISTTGGTIKNLTINTGFRGVFVNHNSDHSELVVLENVVIDGPTYTISCDQGMNQGLRAIDSTFNGWTSYAATIGNAEFINCKFGEGAGYKFCRPYAPSNFVECDFSGDYKMDLQAASDLESCTRGGEDITPENIGNLVTSNVANAGTNQYKAYILGKGGYATLEEAVEAVSAGNNTIMLLADFEGDVTFTQEEGENIVLDGNNKNFDGTIYIHGQARFKGAETLTIQNVNFVTDEGRDFISSNTTVPAERYAHNVTVKDCTFTSNTTEDVVGMRFRQAYNIDVVNCTFENMHSAMWATGVSNGLDFDGITTTNCQNGISVGTSIEVTVKNSQIEAVAEGGYGVRADGEGEYSLNVENCEIDAFAPVLVRKVNKDASVGYSLTVADSTFEASNPKGYEIVVTGEDYDAPDKAIAEPKVINFTFDKPYSISSYVAYTGGKGYTTLDAAIAGAAGEKITLFDDAELNAKLNNATINIDLNGYTMTVNVGANYIIGENSISNGTVDISNVSASQNIFGLAQYQTPATTLTMDKVNFIGDGFNSGYAVFEIGNSGADVALTITDSTIDLKNDNATQGGFVKGYGPNCVLTITNTEVTLDNTDMFNVNVAANITDSKFTIANLSDTAFRNLGGTIDNTVISVTNSSNGIRNSTAGYNLAVTNNSSIKISGSTNTEEGKVGDLVLAAGNKVDVDATSELLVETSTIANADDVTGNVISKADAVYVQYKKIDLDENDIDNLEGADKYEIVLVAADAEKINELASADLTFNFVGTPVNGGAMDYTVAPAEGVTLTQLGDRYMFNYDGVTKYEESGAAIVIGTITIDGYGSYTLATADSEYNAVYATEIRDNIVDGFEDAATLKINTDLAADDDMVGEITDGVVAVPTRELTIDITFPNAVENNVAAYQDMTVTIVGGTVNETIALGTDGVAYNFTRALPYNTAYTVTVSGAGYRTARYTVTMTEDKTLKFWNNVRDEAQFVEVGKDSSKVNVTFLAGDIVKDNMINIYDLSAVVSYFGITNDRTAYNDYAKYDLNRDGVIDSKDVAYVLVSWGN